MEDNREKWQSLDGKLGQLRAKVILAAFFSLAFLFTVSWIAYNSFQEMLASVETLSSPRTETNMVNSMISDITEIQSYSTRHAQNKDEETFKKYSERTVHVRTLIDSLKNEKGSKKYTTKLDTLRTVFDEYVYALDEYAMLLSSNVDASEKKIFGLIKSGDSSLKHTAQFLPKAEIKSVVETIERPTTVEPINKTEKPVKNRLKKNKKTTVAQEAAPVDSVSRETTTKIITTVDSSYLFKVDTLLDQMEKSLNTAQKQRSGFRKKVSERETELLNRELGLMERISTILDDIQQQEIILTKAGIELSKASAERSYKKLTILAIIAIIVMLFLCVTLFSDISKSLFYRKKLQEAKLEAERLAMVKEEFLANMSHEIRTPLNSIIGFTEQLQESDIQPSSKAKVHAVLRSSNHLLALVNDILDFSKLEAGSLNLEQIGFCYTNVIEEVIEMIEPEARKKNIAIHFEPNAASEAMVTGDPVRVKQILLNLVSNAIKFTDKGHITIATELIQDRKISKIKCSVNDTGKGIQEKELEKVFRKFEQEDNSITRHYGGTGLGLSISKKLTEIQNGKIWVESELGIGSTFIFEIPFKSAEKNDYKNATVYVDYIPGLLREKKILVIDDDPMVPGILSPFFTDEKVKAIFEQDPEMAINTIQSQKFDVIFVDLHMPGINGMDLLERVRNDEKSLNKETNTVLCTANVIKNISLSTKQRFPDYVLYKPYKRKDILKTLYLIFGGDALSKKELKEEITPSMEEDFTLKNFKEFAGNDVQLLGNFIELFISESEIELNRLDKYLADKNYKQIGETAHMFKNTYGQLEAKKELIIINRLEGLVKDNDISIDEIKELISELQTRSKDLFIDLKDEMDKLKNEKSPSN